MGEHVIVVVNSPGHPTATRTTVDTSFVVLLSAAAAAAAALARHGHVLVTGVQDGKCKPPQKTSVCPKCGGDCAYWDQRTFKMAIGVLCCAQC